MICSYQTEEKKDNDGKFEKFAIEIALFLTMIDEWKDLSNLSIYELMTQLRHKNNRL